MENLRYGSGNMIVSGLTKQLLPDFQIKDFRTALIVKEGDMRGHVYAFYKDRTVSAWSPNGLYKIRHSLMFNRYPVHGLPVGGLSAVIDNRNPNNPMLIGFQGKQVYYYEVSDKNISEVKRVDHTESRERFPSDITAGFSLNNGFIYVFKGNKYCVREMIYESTDKDQYCNVWYDIRRFLGCWGQYKPPYSLTNYQSSQQNNDFRRDFCNDLKLNGISNDIDGNIILFRGNQYFLLNHFPYETIFVGSGQISDRWPGFKSTEVDAIVVAAEGRKMRGHLIVFKGNKAERMDNKGNVKIVSKSLTSLRAVLQNNEMISSMMIGLGLNLIKYLSINNSELKIVKNVTYDESTANWPLGVTAGIVLNDDIYLFIGDTYCVRKWKCDDKHTKCCKHWKDIRKLFGC
ncbi:uncharacterized protein LOC128964333 [Oppia nitens]|uniref:uncharacterized protein LOC128964333 n=1 Tax=Oppia nitens TaxID=1686743 RepID=UPI0023DA8A43|nr:uncharacterized protein LOC128964333 [Oppia nitens]